VRPETGTEDSQAPPFAVGQPPSLIWQLRFQDAVPFAQVHDDFALFPLEPTEAARDEELQRNHIDESTPIARRGFRTSRRDCLACLELLVVVSASRMPRSPYGQAGRDKGRPRPMSTNLLGPGTVTDTIFATNPTVEEATWTEPSGIPCVRSNVMS
jgi:hypothetical protein